MLDKRIGYTKEEIDKKKLDFEKMRYKAMLNENFIKNSDELLLKKLKFLGVITAE